MSNIIAIIPARMASTRFPGKPLANIAGKPMIAHVLQRVKDAGIGQVVVAACEQEVVDVVHGLGCSAVMTNPDHPTGTDRIFEALNIMGSNADVIINVQGDLPTLEPHLVTSVANLISNHNNYDMGTLAAKITREEEKQDPNVVKAVIGGYDESSRQGKALYFSRATVPYGEGDLYHHIGIYAYRRAALERFVSLAPSLLEQRERLEQLRVLENDMTIGVSVVDTVPLGVDTPEDVARAEQLL